MKTICCGCGIILKPGNEVEYPSHGICPTCIKKLYPDYADRILERNKKV